MIGSIWKKWSNGVIGELLATSGTPNLTVVRFDAWSAQGCKGAAQGQTRVNTGSA